MSVKLTCHRPARADLRWQRPDLTVRSFRPKPNGPRGPLQLMFAYVTIVRAHDDDRSRPARAVISHPAALAPKVKVRVRATIAPDGFPQSFAAVRVLRGFI